MGDEIIATVEQREGVAVIQLAGDVTALAEQVIQQTYRDAVATGAGVIALNFRDTDYINSAGIAILIGIVTQARRAGRRILVAGLSSHFQKIFGMVGLGQYTEVYQTLDEALAHGFLE